MLCYVMAPPLLSITSFGLLGSENGRVLSSCSAPCCCGIHDLMLCQKNIYFSSSQDPKCFLTCQTEKSTLSRSIVATSCSSNAQFDTHIAHVCVCAEGTLPCTKPPWRSSTLCVGCWWRPARRFRKPTFRYTRIRSGREFFCRFSWGRRG